MKLSTSYCEIVRDAGTLFGNIAQGWTMKSIRPGSVGEGKVSRIGLLARNGRFHYNLRALELIFSRHKRTKAPFEFSPTGGKYV